MKTDRYKGLKFLESIGLPVPYTRVVRTVNDIEMLDLYSAEHGWTIRSCKNDGQNEHGLFSINNAQRKKVIEALEQRLSLSEANEFYIVYESWLFLYSMNIYYKTPSYTIEGKYGSQESISKGKGLPDYRIYVPVMGHSGLIADSGVIDDELTVWIRNILRYLKRINWDSYYSEVAVKKDEKIMFYELQKI